MDAATAHEQRAELLLLDVREPHEWAAGHAVDAHHLPMGELAARQDELPRDRPIVAICKSGARSAAVVGALTRAGYRAENLDGGMLAWRAARLPMEAETDAAPIVAR
jgi:rhodanese-related sulfurtransferase